MKLATLRQSDGSTTAALASAAASLRFRPTDVGELLAPDRLAGDRRHARRRAKAGRR